MCANLSSFICINCSELASVRKTWLRSFQPLPKACWEKSDCLWSGPVDWWILLRWISKDRRKEDAFFATERMVLRKIILRWMSNLFVMNTRGDQKEERKLKREIITFIMTSRLLADEQGTCGVAPEGCVSVHHRTGPCIGWSQASRVQNSTVPSQSRSSWRTGAAKSVEVRKTHYWHTHTHTRLFYSCYHC